MQQVRGEFTTPTLRKKKPIYYQNWRGSLTKQELSDLYDLLMEAKNKAPTHPHPMAPQKPSTGNHIVVPVSAWMDKMRDQMGMKTPLDKATKEEKKGQTAV